MRLSSPSFIGVAVVSLLVTLSARAQNDLLYIVGNYPSSITCVAFHASGNLLALSDGQICIVAKGGVLQPLAGLPKLGHALALTKGFRLEPSVKFLPDIVPVLDPPVPILQQFGAPVVAFALIVLGSVFWYCSAVWRKRRPA